MSYLFPVDALLKDSLADLENPIQAAQVSTILNKIPLILMADMVVGTYLFITMVILGGDWPPALWYGTLSVSCLLRGVVIYVIYHYPDLISSLSSRYLYLICGAALGGIVWGSVWFYLPATASSVEHGLIVLWQCGVLAGAAASLSVNSKIFFTFSLPPILITASYLLLQSGTSETIIFGAFLCYVLFIVPMGLHIGADLNRGAKLEQENLKLQKSLKLKKEKLQSQENELQLQRSREKKLVSEVSLGDRRLRAAAEERLLLLESIEVGVFGISNQSKITFANSAALRMLGYSEEDIIGERAIRFVRRRGGNADLFIDTTTALNACVEKGICSTDRQSDFVDKSGKPIPVRFSCRPIKSRGAIIGSVVSFSDITDQKQMEELLVQAQKLEALGRITSGVAHDFNNLLTIVIGNLQFLRKQSGLSDVTIDLIDKMMKAATNGSDLVNRLLGFSKEQRLRLETYNLNELLHDLQGFLARILGESIRLEIDICDDECYVVTDKTRFQNALLNLCVNSKDAMPEGGNLKISASLMDSNWSLPTSRPGLRFVELSVEDNGAGIEQEVLSHIFDPFFSTKESGKGSGLGLSTVYGFMKQSGGSITAQSKVGDGTVFKLYLPLSQEVTKLVDSSPLAEPSGKFQGTILVVEDDDEVRSIAVQILVGAGYEVITAKDGLAGLEQFNKHSEIDLVFTDVIMPGGMTGIEMAERIHKKQPRAPILLVTGYTDQNFSDKIPNKTNIVCLPKPFDANELPKFVYSMITGVAS